MTAIAILQFSPVPAYFCCGWVKSPICQRHSYIWCPISLTWLLHSVIVKRPKFPFIIWMLWLAGHLISKGFGWQAITCFISPPPGSCRTTSEIKALYQLPFSWIDVWQPTILTIALENKYPQKPHNLSQELNTITSSE